MAIVKSNYVKRGKGEKGRAKATIRYIQHRRDRDGQKVTRTLFGYDGALSREQAYTMIDEAPQKGTLFYRIVISPAPAREDRYKDLDLTDVTIHTMLTLEERLGKQIQFVASLHDDHAPHRHVHTLVLVQRKLTREDFQALRNEATKRALIQRRQRDLIRERQHVRLMRSRNTSFKRYTYLGSKPYQSYTCPLCQYHQALPATAGGYRCPSCGIHLRRDRSYGLARVQSRQRGFGLELTLSP
jgi:hypothetical protein